MVFLKDNVHHYAHNYKVISVKLGMAASSYPVFTCLWIHNFISLVVRWNKFSPSLNI